MTDQYKSAYYQHEEPGYLRISGPDRVAFLQRQTTNDIGLLSPEQPLVTVLTSPAGRILDVLWVIDDGEETFGVLTLPGQGDQTAEFLNKRIFFMDKVSIVNKSDALLQLDLFGGGTTKFIQELGLQLEIGENKIIAGSLAEVPIRILIHHEMGSRILVPSAAVRQITSVLEHKNSLPLSLEDYEILRVETGIPAAGHELVEDYTPLEIGFRWAISENKGCYTGQEVIARQVNYDKVTRQLVGLCIDETPHIGDTLYAQENNQPAGTITSLALSPRFGVIALAVIKRPFHQPGTDLILNNGDRVNKAVTNTLPFQ
ncbi:MAG: glycine cleavage T C-terminal barrel domain-containing protein [Anaerolineales bacterium]